jgi:adenine phosphoribosyltransferase
MHNRSDEVKSLIRNIPDFPQKGVIFRDITSLLNSKDGLSLLIYVMECMLNEEEFDKVVAIESRGFILGSLIASIYEKPLVLVRKPGKLPNEVITERYSLEYGENTLSIQTCDVNKGDHCLICDDVIATSGTAQATCRMIEKLGGKVAACYFLIELDFLHGRKLLEDMGIKVISSINY